MDTKEELIEVGKYNAEFNEILGTDFSELKIYRSKGLPSHLLKRKHFNCIKHIDDIPDIINNPDYVGINPNEDDISIELVKKYSKNILIGIKLDKTNDYYYVSTMIDIQDGKLSRRLHSKRLREFFIDKAS